MTDLPFTQLGKHVLDGGRVVAEAKTVEMAETITTGLNIVEAIARIGKARK